LLKWLTLPIIVSAIAMTCIPVNLQSKYQVGGTVNFVEVCSGKLKSSLLFDIRELMLWINHYLRKFHM
jgi:hypothetical protein